MKLLEKLRALRAEPNFNKTSHYHDAFIADNHVETYVVGAAMVSDVLRLDFLEPIPASLVLN